jgi:hypothetical protein
MCPASSCATYQAISIKAEVLSGAEEEEVPLAKTFSGGIKAEPEVSHNNEAALFHCISCEKRYVINVISFICSSKYPK